MEQSVPTTRANESGAPAVVDDPMVAELRRAESLYREMRAQWEEQAAEAAHLRLETAAAHGRAAEAGERLIATERELVRERTEAAAQRQRADQLSSILKELHRSLFSGNIYHYILKACLTLTAAERGMYLTVRGADGRVRVRSAVDVDGYPEEQPSEFIEALCRWVRERRESLVWNANDPPPFIPRPTRPAEQFRNCIVAPVVLMKNFDGIIIAADRLHGEFSQKDIEALLSVGDQATVAVENIRLQRELQHAYLATVSMLADAVEAKDPYTHGHCEMVSRYARLLADELGLSEFERAVVCYAALLHDVGKIGVSDGVLNKPGPLLPEERELVRSHVRVGHDLLRTIPALESVADAVLHHHEWWDGTGYPDGLRGESIPMPARIVAVVDAFGAMVTRRSYKEAYSEEHARDELRRAAGTQFDPHVVEAFVKILDTPEALDRDPDFDAECGVLPGFAHPRNLVRGVTS
jgi:putative nucleotidyltransferase with HDIG domain